MKIRIAIFALIVGAFAVTGCAGSPVAVDRFGNIQPNSQVFQPLRENSALFNFNGYWTNQMFMGFTLPYNQDRSLTLFNFNGFRVKLAPMVDGRF